MEQYCDYYVEAESIDDLCILSPKEIVELAREQDLNDPKPNDMEFIDEFRFGYRNWKDSIREVKWVNNEQNLISQMMKCLFFKG